MQDRAVLNGVKLTFDFYLYSDKEKCVRKRSGQHHIKYTGHVFLDKNCNLQTPQQLRRLCFLKDSALASFLLQHYFSLLVYLGLPIS